jgi:hypothetical protein
MGEVPPAPDRSGLLKACTSAALMQLVVMLAVFIAFPILLYGIVERAETERAAARVQIAGERAVLIAKALAPALGQAPDADTEQLSRELVRYQGDELTLKLFFRPSALGAPPGEGPGVVLIARAPALAPEALKGENEISENAQTAQRLIQLCDGDDPRGLFLTASGNASMALVRVRAAHGCWGIAAVSVLPAAPALWSNPALRITALAYAAMALLAIVSMARVLMTLRRARVADDPAAAPEASPRTPLEEENKAQVPEDNAATPVAEPASAPQPEAPPPEDTAPQSSSPDYLADAPPGLIDVARGAVDLSGLVRTYLDTEREKLSGAAGRIKAQIEDGITINGRGDFIATILGELIGHPLHKGGAVEVHLSTVPHENRRRALLTVAQDATASDEIGRLPYIKQFVAALAAVSAARPREDGGVTVSVSFPI